MSGPRRDRLTLCVTLLHRIYNKCKHCICIISYTYAHISWSLCIYRVTFNYLQYRATRREANRRKRALSSIYPSRRSLKIISNATAFSLFRSRSAAIFLYTFTSLVISIDTLRFLARRSGSTKTGKPHQAPLLSLTHSFFFFRQRCMRSSELACVRANTLPRSLRGSCSKIPHEGLQLRIVLLSCKFITN